MTRRGDSLEPVEPVRYRMFEFFHRVCESKVDVTEYQLESAADGDMFDQQRYMNLTLQVALGEFIDNSLTSYTRLEAPDSACEIRVEVDPNTHSIEIVDNGYGIRQEDLRRLFRMGSSTPDTVGLSRHGMGMKVAAFWWGQCIEIESTALGDDVRRHIKVDISDEATRIPVCSEVPADVAAHETRIKISKAYDERRIPRTSALSNLVNALGSTYLDYLVRGCKIVFNDALLPITDWPCLEAPYWPTSAGPDNNPPQVWREDVSFVVNGRPITGWVGQRAIGNTELAGLVLTWNGKAVRGAAGTPYRPPGLYPGGNSYIDQRLQGRLDISEFEKALTTDGIVWSHDDEEAFVNAIREAISGENWPLVEMINNYRRRHSALGYKRPNDVHYNYQQPLAAA